MIPILKIRDADGNVRDIPAIRGANGKSAYEVAKDNGFVGTEEEWLESLKCDEKPITSVNGVEPDENGAIKLDIPSDEHIKELIGAKIVYGAEMVEDGAKSPYPEGTLYVVIS